ncbi:MAG: sodium:solute symporter [Ignavibacteria bacterium]
MKFSVIDYLIVAAYLIGTIVIGIRTGGKQKDSRDYFLGGKQLRWWAVGLSIVASETSTLTFISIPGLAYKSNFNFLQLVFGYFIGRMIVSLVFIPAYYRGNLVTAYDYIGKRFGLNLRKFTSAVFIVTRVLASGVRLFATAIPVHLITGLSYPISIAIIGVSTLIYTYIGGLRAVVTMDVIQLLIYLLGAAVSMGLIIHYLPNGISDVFYYATSGGVNKLEIFNFNFRDSLTEFFTSPYTFIGAFLGGTFLTMASHGTDQLLVQRLLGCKNKRDSQKALMLDASIIVLQFAFFLFLGLCLYAFYQGTPYNNLVLNSTGIKLSSTDEIFPKFIIESLPSVLSGFVIAGVLASAMGTLSSAISSLASSTYLDLFNARGKTVSPEREIWWSRFFTLFWGGVLIGGAMLFTDSKNPVVELGLSIASFTYGGLLGIFLLGIFSRQINQFEAFIGFSAGVITMIYIIYGTRIAYTWYTLIGVVATIIVAHLVYYVRLMIGKKSL